MWLLPVHSLSSKKHRLYTFILLWIWEAERTIEREERERWEEKEKEREISHLLIHYLNAHHCTWVGPKPERGTQSRPPMWGAGSHHCYLLAFKSGAQPELSNSCMGHRHLSQYLNCYAKCLPQNTVTLKG